MLKKPEWNINHEINKKKTLILKLNNYAESENVGAEI